MVTGTPREPRCTRLLRYTGEEGVRGGRRGWTGIPEAAGNTAAGAAVVDGQN